ncbi:MAG: diadenylate cyclase CdaA [Lachnospiraceae bacterium]|nr:diadenylate cyclase CdaA [Lachnospiraceae bacterium]
MESLKDFFSNIATKMRIPAIGVIDVLEIIIIAFIIYNVMKWVRSTQAWMPMKGLMILLLFWVVASIFKMNVILWILNNTIGVGITAIIIVFQPEIRRALEQLGQQSFASSLRLFGEDKEERFSDKTVEALVKSVDDLAKEKVGALIVIEREVSLKEYEETGIAIDATVSKQLLLNIFVKNTPLHDGAIVLRGDRVAAATCYLPVSKNMGISKALGTRHRAALGVSEVTDSLTIIVSEETGHVSLALNGGLIRDIKPDYLRMKLVEIQKETIKPVTEKKSLKKNFQDKKGSGTDVLKGKSLRKKGGAQK